LEEELNSLKLKKIVIVSRIGNKIAKITAKIEESIKARRGVILK
jgi:hypothetical protein